MSTERTFKAVYQDLSKGYADMALLGTSSDTQLQLDTPESLARYADMIRPKIAADLREDGTMEWTLYGMLVVLFAAVIILAILAAPGGWKATSALPGVSAIWPIRMLMRLRQRNLQLRLLPELLPLLGRQDMAKVVKQFFLEGS